MESWINEQLIAHIEQFDKMLPTVMDLMEAQKDKAVPIEGLFSPLKFGDNSLDCIMISSSLEIIQYGFGRTQSKNQDLF